MDDGPVNPLPAGWPAGPPAPTILQQDRSAPGKPADGRSSAIERRVNVHSEAPPLRARIYSPLAAGCCCCWGPRSDPCCRHARTMTTTQAAHDRHTTHSFIRSRVLRPWMSGRSCSKFGGLVTSSQPAGPMVRASLWVAAAFASSRSRSGSVFTSSSARPLG